MHKTKATDKCGLYVYKRSTVHYDCKPSINRVAMTHIQAIIVHADDVRHQCQGQNDQQSQQTKPANITTYLRT